MKSKLPLAILLVKNDVGSMNSKSHLENGLLIRHSCAGRNPVLLTINKSNRYLTNNLDAYKYIY